MTFAPAALAITTSLALIVSNGCTATCGCVVSDTTAPSTKPVAAPVTPAAPAPVAPPHTPLVELPTPPGAANVPRPSGTPGNLEVLSWAGFTSAVSYTFDDGQ